MIALFKKYQNIIAYLFFGGLTTLINMVVFYIFDTQLGWNYQLANFIAWLVSVLFAFFTNKVWVFGSSYTTVKAFFKELWSFFFFRGLSYFMDAGIMFIGISLLHANSNLTKLIDQFVIVLLNYIFSKFFIFTKKS
ncbi:teichoic acid glycosylation protein GtrA [Ligilactobacillus hayakitensis DSM 18933 = JCM 14209]|uniref:Teichoic acid glycosylation protein GtrA n=1 Tax=Ligilactobacillus hayakitensis DSM 18933 = JCM 14209 TaxID=1423755 RepID=A0A0R1WRJ9_9LACO|nr:GtrA family protein [Ligilactobacillus hayakitensis]KRM20351.1 teichoic acid glycosylation protein GtrA [Ligilactobacillus hayakitensis DSM 18933 = JCM 14209]